VRLRSSAAAVATLILAAIVEPLISSISATAAEPHVDERRPHDRRSFRPWSAPPLRREVRAGGWLWTHAPERSTAEAKQVAAAEASVLAQNAAAATKHYKLAVSAKRPEPAGRIYLAPSRSFLED
jgi:hypothetical protein